MVSQACKALALLGKSLPLAALTRKVGKKRCKRAKKCKRKVGIGKLKKACKRKYPKKKKKTSKKAKAKSNKKALLEGMKRAGIKSPMALDARGLKIRKGVIRLANSVRPASSKRLPAAKKLSAKTTAKTLDKHLDALARATDIVAPYLYPLGHRGPVKKKYKARLGKY